MTTAAPSPSWPQSRRAVVGDALGIGLASGAYAVSLGAVAVASGLSPLQVQLTSVVMFTGASQFALVGILGAGGGAVAAVLTALLLGARNGLYGLHMAPLLGSRGPQRLLAAHLTLDETTAMALSHEDGPDGSRAARLAFWATGLSVFVCWNTGTLVGSLGAAALGDPRALGLDAAIPAAFLALLWPRLRDRQTWAVALGGALVALVLTPALQPGLPVLAAALVAVAAGVLGGRREGAR